MKRFAWRLQRLLDLKVRQHELLKAELVALSEQAAQLRAQIMMQKMMIRSRLAEIRMLSPDQRLHNQQMFLQYAHVLDTRIKNLGEHLAVVDAQRKEKIRHLLDVRKERKSLEKLREKARQDYQVEWNRFEQKAGDEAGGTRYARRILMTHSESDMPDSGNAWQNQQPQDIET